MAKNEAGGPDVTIADLNKRVTDIENYLEEGEKAMDKALKDMEKMNEELDEMSSPPIESGTPYNEISDLLELDSDMPESMFPDINDPVVMEVSELEELNQRSSQLEFIVRYLKIIGYDQVNEEEAFESVVAVISNLKQTIEENRRGE